MHFSDVKQILCNLYSLNISDTDELGSLLLTWINFDPSMDMLAHVE